MLGSMLDKICVACSKQNGKLPSEVEHYSFDSDKPNENWVFFLPEFCYRFPLFRNRFIFDGMNAEVYVLPKYSSLVQPKPESTQRFLDNVFEMAIERQKELHQNKINVLGISLGNVLAFRLAKEFKVNKFISVVPGSRLAECIWESIATRKIAESGRKNLDDYRRSLANYNPIEDASEINPLYSEMHLGISDLMIPYGRGAELAKMMRQKKRKLSLHLHSFSGHVETIISFSKRFKKIAEREYI